MTKCCLCLCTADKPKILGDDEITDGETLKVLCLVPINYLGGDCRLYREGSDWPFKLLTATSYTCEFLLTSREVLGNKPVGSTVRLRCDYKIQEYTSVSSDTKLFTVSGTRPSPSLSISRHFVSPDDTVEVTCSPPVPYVSSCIFYREQFYLSKGSCSRNITYKELIKYERPTLLHSFNITCTYDPDHYLSIRSEHSNQELLFVVDPSRVTSSVGCSVSVSEDRLETLGDRTWGTSGPNGTTITVQVSGGPNLEKTCNYNQNPTNLI